METVTDFLFSGCKITVDDDCNREIKRCLLLERKAMTNLNKILKSRDITLPTKVQRVKAMVFPVVMYGCESWTTTIIRTRRDLPLIESIVVLMVKNTPQFVVIHTIKGLGIVNNAKVHVFFWNSLAFSMIQRMLAI